MDDREIRATAKAAAISVLSLAVGHGGGGYYSEFGMATRKQLVELITNGFDDYCEVFCHIKHAEMDKCIICGCALQNAT